MAICGVPPPSLVGGCRLRVPPWGGRVYGFSARASFAYLLIQSNVWRWRGGWRARPRAPPKGVRPNKSVRPRNTAVTTAAVGKMRLDRLHYPHLRTFRTKTLKSLSRNTNMKMYDCHFNWNHFHRQTTAGATLETGMRATVKLLAT